MTNAGKKPTGELVFDLPRVIMVIVAFAALAFVASYGLAVSGEPVSVSLWTHLGVQGLSAHSALDFKKAAAGSTGQLPEGDKTAK